MNKPTITLTATEVQTILTPSPYMRKGCIQNNGDYNLRYTMDGHTDPTADMGLIILAGTQLWLSQDQGRSNMGVNPPLGAIRAIAVGGDTLVDVGSDDLSST